MSFTFIRGLRNLPCNPTGAVATIGTFDGVHRGHQAIMAQVHERAIHYGLPAMVIFFEPHPMEFFLGEKAPAKLMRMRDKVEALEKENINQIFCLQFNRKLRSMQAQDFIEKVLVKGIGLRCLIVGDDFRFGCDGKGNSSLLKAAGEKFGFEVFDTATVEYNGRRISSTWVREAIEQSNFALANKLLGRNFYISGRVVHGEKMGRQMGVPTANVNLKRQRAPLSGVFIVEVTLGNERLPAVANVGVRPTVGDLIKPILEVHMLDWSGDIYGRYIRVEFIDKVRDEQQFSGIEELRARIHSDIETAKTFFARRENPGLN